METQIPLTGKSPPPGWRIIERRSDGELWQNDKRQMRVIASVTTEQDGRKWLHLSMSHRNRVPTYDELTYMKRHWAGDDRKCIMVLPEKSEYININPYVLHLFCCLDGDPLPDFTQGKNTL